ncbi:hypothetical protein [Fibrella aestuarina]|nr:hypothetical protein [Fibrella aestuarina]
MHNKEQILNEVPQPAKRKHWFLNKLVDFLINLADDLFDDLLDHIKEKRRERQQS